MATDDELLRLFSPLTVSDEVWEDARTDVDAIIERTGLTEGSRVLVMPRSVGQHAIAFAQRGMKVTAVGGEDDTYEFATTLAQQEGLEIDFPIAEPDDYVPEGSYDLILNVSSSFNFLQPAEGKGILERLNGALGPGGTLVMRLITIDESQSRIPARDWKEAGQGHLLLEELEYDWDIGWISHRWMIVTRDGRRYEFHLGHRGYDSNWVAERLNEAGFGEIDKLGSLSGQPFESDTPLVVYATKSA